MVKLQTFTGIFFIIISLISCGGDDGSPNGPNNTSATKVNKIAFNNIEDGLGENFGLAIINPNGTGLA